MAYDPHPKQRRNDKKVFMSRELNYAVPKIQFWAARLLFDIFNGP